MAGRYVVPGRESMGSLGADRSAIPFEEVPKDSVLPQKGK